MKTDLTFAELNTALGGSAITHSGSDVTISVAAITGDSYTDIDSEGVLEFLFKLRQYAGVAQETVNESLAEGDRLDSFPGFSFSPPVDGASQVTQTQTFNIPLDTSRVNGLNA